MPMPLEILTPHGAVYETDAAAQVAVIGQAGDLQVEPGHINLMTTLRIGRCRVRTEDGTEALFAVHGGFLEATPKGVLILADAAERATDVDVARARSARRRAERRLGQREAETDLPRAEAALKRALLRLDVAGNRSET